MTTSVDAAFHISAAVLREASLTGTTLRRCRGATLLRTVRLGLVFAGLNLDLQPILRETMDFLAGLADGQRGQRMKARLRRTIRPTVASG